MIFYQELREMFTMKNIVTQKTSQKKTHKIKLTY